MGRGLSLLFFLKGSPLVATKYIQKFDSIAEFEGQTPVTGAATPIGSIGGELRIQDANGASIPVGFRGLKTEVAAFAATPEDHANRTTVFSLAAGFAITVPAASGTGNKYRFVSGIALTGDTTITAPSGTILKGAVLINNSGDTTAATADVYPAGSSDEVITFDASEGAGKVGDYVELEDIASGVYAVSGLFTAMHDPATPFSSAA